MDHNAPPLVTRRGPLLVVSTVVLLTGTAFIVLAIVPFEDLFVGLGGLGLFLAGAIYLNFAIPILRATKIERSTAYVNGCSPQFLATLSPALRCSACGYDLRGHDADAGEVRCPECGMLA